MSIAIAILHRAVAYRIITAFKFHTSSGAHEINRSHYGPMQWNRPKSYIKPIINQSTPCQCMNCCWTVNTL